MTKNNKLSKDSARAMIAKLLEEGKKTGFLTVDRINEIIGDSIYRVNYVFWGLPINGFCSHQFAENGIQFAFQSL